MINTLTSNGDTSSHHHKNNQNTSQPFKLYTNDSYDSERSLNKSEHSRSVSIEEPTPSSFLAAPIAKSSNKHKLVGLHISVDAATLETDSESKHIQNIYEKKECDTNNGAFICSPDSISPPLREHVPTYSDCTASTDPQCVTSPASSGGTEDSNYIPLSPINTEQAIRNICYNQRQHATDDIISDLDLTSPWIGRLVDDVIMTQCTTQSGSGAANKGTDTNNAQNKASKNNDHDRSDDNNNNNTDNDNNNNSGYSGSRGNGNRNGNGDDDDDKKRNNNDNKNDDDDEEEVKEDEEDDDEEEVKEDEEDEDEEKEEEKESKLNYNAQPFVPFQPTLQPLRIRSKSANSASKLPSIDEHNVLCSSRPITPRIISTKSAPNHVLFTPPSVEHDVCTNTHKENNESTLHEHHRVNVQRKICSTPVIRSTKSAPITSKTSHIYAEHCKYKRYVYTPNQRHRAQGWIKVPMYLTQTIIPTRIREHLVNVYDYLDKSTGIAMYNKSIIDVHNGRIKIFDFGFHDIDNDDMLYLIADKQNQTDHRKCEYVMRERMYTKDEIYNLYNIALNDSVHRVLSACAMDKVNGIFHDNPAALCQNVIFKTKWHKLPIHHAMNNNNYNKQRLTFAMTKTEFINVIQQCIYNSENHHTKALIPIIMFNDNGYRVEYVQMVEIRNNIHIGISYIYNTQRNTFKATGIHLNKENIQKQHQLISPHHDCDCLDDFHSDIDDIHIGNPDDDKNRIKDLRKKNDGLHRDVHDLNDTIQQLRAYINRSLEMPSPINLTPVSPYIIARTPQSVSTISNTPQSMLITPQSTATNTSVTPQSSTSSTKRVTFTEYTAKFRK